MYLFNLGFFCGLASASYYAVKEVHPVPKLWSRVDGDVGHHTMRLSIALKQGQFEEFERQLYEVSNPFHVRYGQHLSTKHVNDLLRPSKESTSQVYSWLQEHGFPSETLTLSSAGDWISFNASVNEVERLLDTKYSMYRHEDGSSLIRTPSWSLPKHLHRHIDAIQPTNSFFRSQSMRTTIRPIKENGRIKTRPIAAAHAKSYVKGQSVAEACNSTLITPNCLSTLYGTVDYIPGATSKNKIALTNYLGESSNRSDATIFLQTYRPEAVEAARNFVVETVNGGVDQQTPIQDGSSLDVEGNLDAQTMLALTYPTPLLVYNTGGEPPFNADTHTPTNSNEPYLDWLQYVLNQTTLPQTISTSYGDDEQTVPYSYANSVCNLFAQLGARGTTVLFSSGDDGVGADGACISNDGKNATRFLPSFPASCPYVTAVGATKGIPEVAAYDAGNGFSSGGGFSNYFPRPKYQDAVVESYLALTNATVKFGNFFNASGRAYPDISAQGQDYAVVWGGQVVDVDGTSASSPCAASVLSLVSDSLIAAGKSPLGFLNPWLYTIGHEGFTDVVSGSTLGCLTNGFEAAISWDPVTGFGTPYFPKLRALAAQNNSQQA